MTASSEDRPTDVATKTDDPTPTPSRVLAGNLPWAVFVFGLPLAIGMGDPGREIEGPMALVILGGLTTSMALNLLVLPTLALRFGRFVPAVDEFGGGSSQLVAAEAITNPSSAGRG